MSADEELGEQVRQAIFAELRKRARQLIDDGELPASRRGVLEDQLRKGSPPPGEPKHLGPCPMCGNNFKPEELWRRLTLITAPAMHYYDLHQPCYEAWHEELEG